MALTMDEKFTAIFRRYHRWMLAIAEGIVFDQHLAEDIVQNAFIKILNHLSDIDEVESKGAKFYCATVTRNEAIDQYRKKNRHVVENLEDYEEVLCSKEADVVDLLLEQMDCEEILRLVRELPDTQQYVFLYRHSYQLDFEKIAELLGITAENARKKHQRARRHLIKALKKEMEYES